MLSVRAPQDCTSVVRVAVVERCLARDVYSRSTRFVTLGHPAGGIRLARIPQSFAIPCSTCLDAYGAANDDGDRHRRERGFDVADDRMQRLPRYTIPEHLQGTSWRFRLGGALYELVLKGHQPSPAWYPESFVYPLDRETAIRKLHSQLEAPDVRDRVIQALRRINIEPNEDELDARVAQALTDRQLVLFLCVPKVYDRAQLKGLASEEPHPFGASGHPPLQPDPPRPNKVVPTSFELRLVDELGASLPGVMLHVRVDSLQPIKTDGDGRVRAESPEGRSFGSALIGDPKSVRDLLAERWTQVRGGEPLPPAAHHTFLTCPPDDPLADVARIQLTKNTPHTAVVCPDVVMAGFVGLFFDKNKTFLLPNADFPGIKPLYDANPNADLLIVGHTDATGTPEYNEVLSLERAESIAAYLRDDVDAWLRNYSASAPQERRWGSIEDQSMLHAILERDPQAASTDRVRYFQRANGLADDGVIGDQTRRVLVTQYMGLDGVTVPSTMAVQSHGCGENFPRDSTEEVPVEASVEREASDRRVELFFFGDRLGVLPPPPGSISSAGSTEYPEWRRRAQTKHEWINHESQTWVTIELVHEVDGKPAAGFTIRLQVDSGEELLHTTGSDGLATFVGFPRSETVAVNVFDERSPSGP